MSPVGPIFRRIESSDAALIRRATAGFLPPSDMSPLGLFCWNTKGDAELAKINGNLALKLLRYDGNGYVLAFIGTHEVAKTTRQLLAYGRSHPDVDPALRPIPEVVVRHVAGLRERYAVTAIPEDFDYIFGLADMAALVGPDHSEKRTAIRRLQTETAPELRRIDVRDPYAQALMLDLFDRWANAKEIATRSETENERLALQRLFTFADLAGDNLIALALFDVVGAPLGFCTAEALCHGFAIGHFEKTDPSLPGVSALLRQRIAHYLLASGSRYLNGEQDLGDPGLRESKRSWAPRFFLRKYAIAES